MSASWQYQNNGAHQRQGQGDRSGSGSEGSQVHQMKAQSPHPTLFTSSFSNNNITGSNGNGQRANSRPTSSSSQQGNPFAAPGYQSSFQSHPHRLSDGHNGPSNPPASNRNISPPSFPFATHPHNNRQSLSNSKNGHPPPPPGPGPSGWQNGQMLPPGQGYNNSPFNANSHPNQFQNPHHPFPYFPHQSNGLNPSYSSLPPPPPSNPSSSAGTPRSGNAFGANFGFVQNPPQPDYPYPHPARPIPLDTAVGFPPVFDNPNPFTNAGLGAGMGMSEVGRSSLGGGGGGAAGTSKQGGGGGMSHPGFEGGISFGPGPMHDAFINPNSSRPVFPLNPVPSSINIGDPSQLGYTGNAIRYSQGSASGMQGNQAVSSEGLRKLSGESRGSRLEDGEVSDLISAVEQVQAEAGPSGKRGAAGAKGKKADGKGAATGTGSKRKRAGEVAGAGEELIDPALADSGSKPKRARTKASAAAAAAARQEEDTAHAHAGGDSMDEMDTDDDSPGGQQGAGGKAGDANKYAGMSKEEIRKEKNRDKQRRLRMRRANQLQNLQETAQSHQEQISQLEQERDVVQQRADRKEAVLLAWIQELEENARQIAGQQGADQVSAIRQKYEESLRSESEGEGDFRVRQGRTNDNSNSNSNSFSDGRSGALVLASPLLQLQRGTLQTSNSLNAQRMGGDQLVYPTVRSPVSIQALLDPAPEDQGMGWNRLGEGTGQVMAYDRGLQQVGMDEYAIIEGLPAFQPGGEVPFGVFLENTGQAGPPLRQIWNFGIQPTFFPPPSNVTDIDSQLSNMTPPLESNGQWNEQGFVLEPRVLMDLTIDQVEAMTDSALLHHARCLIVQTQPHEAYTPGGERDLTSSSDELPASAVAARNFRAYMQKTSLQTPPPTGLGDFALPSRPAWRKSYTPAQLYLLFRALMDASHPAGSKNYFDSRRIAELTYPRKKDYENWEAYEGKDIRVHRVPAMIMRLRIIMCAELADKGDLDLTAFMDDVLHEAILYGNAWSMYCWELPDSFWDRWCLIFPAGRDFCRSLRAWRRKDTHPGARPFEIIMGTEAEGARRRGGLELPPTGWEEAVPCGGGE